jgi:hypothetical protein
MVHELFFNYTTKRGYYIVATLQSKQLSFDSQLGSHGLHSQTKSKVIPMHLAPLVTKENLINDLANMSRRLAIGEGLPI